MYFGCVPNEVFLNRLALFSERFQADFGLIFLTMIWGTSFSLVKTALQDISPLLFLSIRFWIGGLILVLFLGFQKGLKITKKTWIHGTILGVFMFFGMGLQTVGLKYTTASKSGFITGLAVFFVPMVVVFIEKTIPRKMTLLGVVLATIGVYAFTSPRGGGFNYGDLLTLGCAFSFAFEIVYVEVFGKQNDTMSLAAIMVIMTAVFASLGAVFLETPVIAFTGRMLLPLFITATLATALGFYLQLHWQPSTSATAAAVIYTMEPVFAAFFAMLFMGDRLTGTGWFGAGLIICGMLLAEVKR